jgi:hypothetical protein
VTRCESPTRASTRLQQQQPAKLPEPKAKLVTEKDSKPSVLI